MPTHTAARALPSLVLLLTTLLAPSGAAAQTVAGTRWTIPALDSALEQARQAWEIPGMAVAIVRGDTVLLAKGYGVRELGKPERVDANTIFDAASLTKSFTSAAAAALVDEGRIRWDDPVRRHLPRIELGSPFVTMEVTMRDLLSHRTGLEPANASWYFGNASRDELLQRVRHLEARMGFRTGLVYSNVGYTIAGEAAATAAGVSWEDLIRTRLLEPLGMTRSTASFTAAGRLSNVASPHAMVDGAQRPIAREGRGRDVTAPAGAVQSSATDMAQWLRFQLSDGSVGGRRIVSAAALRETQSAQVIVPTTAAFRSARSLRHGAAYGMGWQVWDNRGHPMLWHSGTGDGQMAFMALFPETRLGVVVLINSWLLTSVPPTHGIIAGCISDALLGLNAPNCVSNARELRAGDAARWNAGQRALDSARVRGTRPSHQLAAYHGTYVDSLYGDIHVRTDSAGRLALQIGASGEIADLSHWHFDSFLAEWRRPFQRAYFSTLATFGLSASGEVSSLRMRLRSDETNATRRPAPR